MASVWQYVLYPQGPGPIGDTSIWEEPAGAGDTPGWFQPTNQPVLPQEYRYLLPSGFYGQDLEQSLTTDEESGWFLPTNVPLRVGEEYRYLLPAFFSWLDTNVTVEGFLVEARPRSLTMYMPSRTLKAELREGGREAT